LPLRRVVEIGNIAERHGFLPHLLPPTASRLETNILALKQYHTEVACQNSTDTAPTPTQNMLRAFGSTSSSGQQTTLNFNKVDHVIVEAQILG